VSWRTRDRPGRAVGAGVEAGGADAVAGGVSAAGSRWRGRKKRLAIIVGTTALAMTAATRKLYGVSMPNVRVRSRRTSAWSLPTVPASTMPTR